MHMQAPGNVSNPSRCLLPPSTCAAQLVLKTTDAGATWVQQTVTGSLPNQPAMTAISMLDANVFYIVGNSATCA